MSRKKPLEGKEELLTQSMYTCACIKHIDLIIKQNPWVNGCMIILIWPCISLPASFSTNGTQERIQIGENFSDPSHWKFKPRHYTH
jgi:beta-lactamase regulating signal transducer with metallopeptidase domain